MGKLLSTVAAIILALSLLLLSVIVSVRYGFAVEEVNKLKAEAAREKVIIEYREKPWVCELNQEELDLVQRVVMAESGNQSFDGQVAVAQCIFDRMLRDGESATEVVTKPSQFASPTAKEVSNSVKYAVYAVFHDGLRITEEPIYSFYSTVGGFVSSSHEEMNHIVTIEDHKFFN